MVYHIDLLFRLQDNHRKRGKSKGINRKILGTLLISVFFLVFAGPVGAVTPTSSDNWADFTFTIQHSIANNFGVSKIMTAGQCDSSVVTVYPGNPNEMFESVTTLTGNPLGGVGGSGTYFVDYSMNSWVVSKNVPLCIYYYSTALGGAWYTDSATPFIWTGSDSFLSFGGGATISFDKQVDVYFNGFILFLLTLFGIVFYFRTRIISL